MNLERDFHMDGGDRESSYTKNSRRQEIVVFETKPIIENATKEVYMDLHPQTMVVADLGCSTGPNSLLFITNVINIIDDQCNKSDERDPVELQFFLNDLPGNDFNQLFRTLEKINSSAKIDHKGDTPPSYYICGLPKSYYDRLFPRESVHLFHSSYCLHWRSQVPEGLEDVSESYVEQDNIYITKTTTSLVVKKLQKQFHKDFSIFLKLRHEELVYRGQMILTFLGRKDDDVYNGDLNILFGLVAKSLQSLVAKGLVEKKKLASFNLPVYGPSVTEVIATVKQNHMFEMCQIKLFEANWDPYDDTEGDVVHDNARSSLNVTGCIRSVLKSLIECHFGESILDPLFVEFTCLVAKHLEMEKTKFAIIIMSLKKI